MNTYPFYCPVYILSHKLWVNGIISIRVVFANHPYCIYNPSVPLFFRSISPTPYYKQLSLF